MRGVEAFVLGIGHLRHAHAEGLVDIDRMDGSLVPVELTPFVANAPRRFHR